MSVLVLLRELLATYRRGSSTPVYPRLRPSREMRMVNSSSILKLSSTYQNCRKKNQNIFFPRPASLTSLRPIQPTCVTKTVHFANNCCSLSNIIATAETKKKKLSLQTPDEGRLLPLFFPSFLLGPPAPKTRQISCIHPRPRSQNCAKNNIPLAPKSCPRVSLHRWAICFFRHAEDHAHYPTHPHPLR